ANPPIGSHAQNPIATSPWPARPGLPAILRKDDYFTRGVLRRTAKAILFAAAAVRGEPEPRRYSHDLREFDHRSGGTRICRYALSNGGCGGNRHLLPRGRF